MNEHLKFIQRLRNLFEDCGLPEKAHSQGGDLLVETWFMLEEHLEMFE
tara:strand:+ start:400 stop:543 length:144 start_codon:yes stop_codon:yes gene_type:complete